MCNGKCVLCKIGIKFLDAERPKIMFAILLLCYSDHYSNIVNSV
jgi:hypothetical protein